jgi:N-acetyl-anhydromuramyl-L-alanine amidase AmpD
MEATTMALNRVWIPSPNYSSRGGTKVRLVVVHTAEGSKTIESLGSFFANPSSGVSSHTGADDKVNTVAEYVRADQKAWTQANANPYSVAIELCAFASWDAAEWSRHINMLTNCAAWIAEECARFSIPIVGLSKSQAQGGASGVCGHDALGAAGGGHWDPGPSFPWGDVLAMAGGQAGTVAPPAPGAGSGGTAPGAGAPPFPGVLLSNYHRGDGTATWQGQMAERGWRIAVDDQYGAESERVAYSFQREKGLGADGVVGPETWAAAWTAPVT